MRTITSIISSIISIVMKVKPADNSAEVPTKVHCYKQSLLQVLHAAVQKN